MAGRSGGQGPQRPMKGFRPGKEPPELKKRRAKQQFGEVNAAQERLIELFAQRTPEESRTLMRRWRIGLLVAAVVLGVVGALLYMWSTAAGVVANVLALVLIFFWWRLRRQREDFEAMADAVSGRGPSGDRR